MLVNMAKNKVSFFLQNIYTFNLFFSPASDLNKNAIQSCLFKKIFLGDSVAPLVERTPDDGAPLCKTIRVGEK